MFRTHRSMQLDTPTPNAETALWACVEQPLRLPWFYVDVRYQGHSTLTAVQIMDPELFVELLENNADGISIETVQLVTPAKMNGSPFWKMEELITFSYVHHPNFGGTELYETAEGGVYWMLEQCVMQHLESFSKKIIYSNDKKSGPP